MGGARLSLACVLIVSAHRIPLVRDAILPTVLRGGFDDVVVVGDFLEGAGYRYCHVPPITRTTIDALVKRDVGALATDAESILYLCDDHVPAGDFAQRFDRHYRRRDDWDVLVPARFVYTEHLKVPLNMGGHPALPSVREPSEACTAAEQLWKTRPTSGYCGGHAGVFRRRLVQQMPWSTMPHDRLWDLLASQRQQQRGAEFIWTDDLEVYDLEGGAPWR